jgi:surface antigen
VGYAVVWNRGHPTLSGTPGAQHGHVAIIEQVEPDAIVVSHTNWGNSYRMKITREQLINWRLYFIP